MRSLLLFRPLLISSSVRRADLHSDSSSSQSPSPNENLYIKKLAATYHVPSNPLFASQGPLDEKDVSSSLSEDVEAFEFSLFSKRATAGTSEGASASAPKIQLRSPSPINPIPGFIVPRRPHDYYFTGQVTSERSVQFRQAAVSGEQIIQGLRTRWVSLHKVRLFGRKGVDFRQKGCELPWRVTVISSTSPINGERGTCTVRDVDPVGRRRKGKKRRITIRKRSAIGEQRKKTSEQTRGAKEEAEKEKRNKKNRERKVKRRQKEREKKAVQALEAG